MDEYHKIHSVYKRDPSGKQLLLGEYARPEFAFLESCDWIFTEKVDGTNIRVMWDGETVKFGGKTDNASIPVKLLGRLAELFPARKFEYYYLHGGGDYPAPAMCLYGEGYGGKIQSGGHYCADPDFVLFDVRVGQYWLSREKVEDVAARLAIDVVPMLFQDTLSYAVDFVRQGFESAWGPFQAEGIVGVPSTPLFNNQGERVIVKIKHKDFR